MVAASSSGRSSSCQNSLYVDVISAAPRAHLHVPLERLIHQTHRGPDCTGVGRVILSGEHNGRLLATPLEHPIERVDGSVERDRTESIDDAHNRALQSLSLGFQLCMRHAEADGRPINLDDRGVITECVDLQSHDRVLRVRLSRAIELGVIDGVLNTQPSRHHGATITPPCREVHDGVPRFAGRI